MKTKIITKDNLDEKYHVNDKGFNSDCGGWRRAVNDFKIPERLEDCEKSEYYNHGHYYIKNIPEMAEEIELLSQSQILSILECYISHLFLKLALYAENKRNTSSTEEELNNLKAYMNIIKKGDYFLLSTCNDLIIQNNNYLTTDQLNHSPEPSLDFDLGSDLFVKKINLATCNVKLYIFFEPLNKRKYEPPQIRIFEKDDKINFLAIHQENLKKMLPENLQEKFLLTK